MSYSPFESARAEVARLEALLDEAEGEERQYLMAEINAIIRTLTM